MTENTNSEATAVPYTPVAVTLETLLEAGAHFGHKVENWNPKMLPYIYGRRNDVYVINLDKTLEAWTKCRKIIRDMASAGRNFLFVGTKDQARDIVASAATRAGAFYINNRWLGGTLTNFETIRRSINKMNKLEDFLTQAEAPDTNIKVGKKEKIEIRKELDRLAINLTGIRQMKGLPDVIFITDIKKDEIAVVEARRLQIPIIALADTNTDPNKVDYPIPSNDDSRSTLALFVNAVADAVAEGRAEYQARPASEQQQKPEQSSQRRSRGRGDRSEKAEKGEKGEKGEKADKKAATVETPVTVN